MKVIGKSGSGQADYIGKVAQGSAVLSKIGRYKFYTKT